ncbi:MAG: OmcA/MtrC family decaheme c-type cytochrome [Steroidobacteraceae bacterium]|nr:OmcA/MtrC family decaheme c-type cytochrome [Steroidobacteraceae bacterium]
MKFGNARGITRSRVSLLALMATAAVTVAACGGSGRSGGGGSVGPTGPTGPTGSGGALAISQAEVVNVTVVNASVASGTLKPSVTFQLTNDEGKPLDGLQAANVRVTFAKVIPGSNWIPSEWQSYISRVDSPDPTANPVPPATPAAEQKPTEYATYESAVATVGGTPCTPVGVFEVLGGGQYKYTFAKGLPEYSGVSYNPSETQRVGIQLRGDTTCAPGANTDKLIELTPQALVTNGVYDFVPGGGLPASPDIINPEQCNACHVRLSAHGGGRNDFAFCVTCHNPGTVQSATNTSFDMMYMAHQIHMGGNLAIPFPIWVPARGNTAGYMDYPFADVTYPQDMRNCLTCHNDSASGSAWRTAVTIANCTSCHDTSTFTGPNPTHGGGPASEDQCTNCHVQSNLPQLSVAGAHGMSTQAPLQPSTPSVREYAKRFKYEIVSLNAASFAPGGFPTFTFRVVDPTNGNAPYNIYSSPYFSGGVCSNGTARLAFDIGWSTADINNAGSGSGPGQPISLNPLAGCPAAPATSAGVVANADGTYTMTSSIAIPAGVTGTAVIGFEGHPAGDLDGNGVYSDRIPVTNVFKIAAVTGATPSPRRTVVNITRCDACHKVLSLHGNNRTDEPQVCVICHNPAATDINRRTGATMTASASCAQGLVSTVDGRCEQTIDFKRMVHMIHASELQPSGSPFVVYGFGGSVNDFAEVTYPPGSKISQCETCHEPDTYYPVDPTLVQATTTDTGASIISQTDDTGITPNTSVCSACHTDSTAALHMTQNGGSFNAPKPASGIVTSPLETCSVCHGPGQLADVKLMHKIGIYKSGAASN